MLRKIITLAVTAVLAKKAWEQYQASRPAMAGTEPLAAPDDDVEQSSVTAQPVMPESPMHYH